jgi:hypothetical protein
MYTRRWYKTQIARASALVSRYLKNIFLFYFKVKTKKLLLIFVNLFIIL